MKESMLQEYAGMLRAAGFKATPGRKALLNALGKSRRPVSIPEAAHTTGLDEATVYRALEALSDAGVVQRVSIDRSRTHYELAGGDHHHHVVCDGCGVVEDVEICDAHGLEKEALKQSKSFTSIKQHSLEFFGTCRNCSR